MSETPATPDPTPVPSAPPTTAPVGAAPPGDGSAPTGPTAKTWIISGVAAAVIAVGAIVGLKVASSDDSVKTASTATPTTAANGTGSNGSTGSSNGTGAGQGFGRRGTFGTIASIDGSNLTVTGQDGTTTKVTTTGDTTVTANTEGALTDLKVGDHIRAMGSGSETAVTAQRVTDSGDKAETGFGPGAGGQPPAGGSIPEGATPPEGMTPPDGAQAPTGANGQVPSGGFPGGDFSSVSGTIASIEGSTITVTKSDGSTATVTVDDSTTYTISKTITVADLKKGDTVMVRGDNTDGTVAATAITSGEMAFGGRGFPGGQGAPGQSGTAPSTTAGSSGGN